MLANLEISLDERPPGDRRGINQILIEHHPGRTLESIKCARKSQRYRDLIQKLRNQRSAAPAVARTPDPDEMPATEASAEVADPTWAEDLLELLRETPCDPTSLGLPDLVPGNPSQQVRDRIDSEYLEWQPPRPTGPSHPPPHPRRDLPTRPRARRRAMYARVQSDYKRNRGRTAKRILSGEWASEAPQIPLDELDSFWREIFTTPSAEDTRSPTSAGPTQWGLVAPVTRDELLAALKGMKDGAPGPDGRKLRDLKGIPR